MRCEFDHPDAYASHILLRALNAAIEQGETDARDILAFVVGYITSYDADIGTQCSDILRAVKAYRTE